MQGVRFKVLGFRAPRYGKIWQAPDLIDPGFDAEAHRMVAARMQESHGPLGGQTDPEQNLF